MLFTTSMKKEKTPKNVRNRNVSLGDILNGMGEKNALWGSSVANLMAISVVTMELKLVFQMEQEIK